MSPDLTQREVAVGDSVDVGPRSRILAAGRLLIITRGADFTTQNVIQEAGVALQTFYRYFASKDQLFLTLIGQLISEHCVALTALAHNQTDPQKRLEIYVRGTLAPLRAANQLTSAQFITAEHWRLHQTLPAEVWAATQPFSDLIQAELEAGAAAGTLSPHNPERDAWLMTKTVIGAYHHYAFQSEDPAMATLDDDVWHFCLSAVGGAVGTKGSEQPPDA
jgi:TetR/AcrR family transcriptional regulator